MRGESRPESVSSFRNPLDIPLQQVRGIGPRLLEAFARMGLATVEDALYTLPFRYEDRRSFRRIGELREGVTEVFAGEIVAAGESVTPHKRKKLYEVIVTDGTGRISLKWFRYRRDWMRRFTIGRRGVFIGEVKRFGSLREVHHPEAEFIEGSNSSADLAAADPLNFGRILPVYPLTEGLQQKTARKIWKEIVDRFAPRAVSAIPDTISAHRLLLPLGEALREAHWPSGNFPSMVPKDGRHPAARRTLVYDEFFFLELGLALRRKGVVLEEGIPFQVTHRYTKPLAALLPYRLTTAQRRVLGEIKADLMVPHPMNRLVQGDVGSGKTIVALMAALVAIENETQVAVVAPTEILAEQHFLQFRLWMESLGLRTALLSGSIKGKSRDILLEQIRSGEIHMVVGTHAVLQEGVQFHRLGLGIVDEQHRFGVRQRGLLRRKGLNPHILVMTATPIPRTLALTLYGDLSLSVIDEMPPGRTPVRTRIVTENQRSKVYSFIQSELAAGRQAYIVYPLVAESENSDLLAASEGADRLQREIFDDFRVGLLHGRMKPEEKEQTMKSFKRGELQVLVSTTVIEVGIDVPNATVMLIEHAERFGLAQLHQLRGRVGRGTDKSTCILLRSLRCSEDGMKRLQVMSETNDGFRIAEADLEIRGPGEFLGTRQAGIPDFRVADLLRDGRVLEEARADAFELANEPGFAEDPRYAKVRETLLLRWGNRLELASIG